MKTAVFLKAKIVQTFISTAWLSVLNRSLTKRLTTTCYPFCLHNHYACIDTNLSNFPLFIIVITHQKSNLWAAFAIKIHVKYSLLCFGAKRSVRTFVNQCYFIQFQTKWNLISRMNDLNRFEWCVISDCQSPYARPSCNVALFCTNLHFSTKLF